MRVLLTGASSFTGYWFAAKLHAAGIAVVAPLKRALADYSGVRGVRVQRLGGIAEVVPDCGFGGERFLALVAEREFQLLCHHAARTGGYRDSNFDATAALTENTRNIHMILPRMQRNGTRAVVLTGSVFEANEGAGDAPLRAFSPYGLSKGLTSDVVRHWCGHFGLGFAKFVVANPFGPFEEPRFCAYLIETWRRGEAAEVRTPDYVRDNIHVDLLALAYAQFVQHAAGLDGEAKSGPMGYVETQGAFAARFAAAIRPRLRWDCALRLAEQTDFTEPRARTNTHAIDTAALGWSEERAWDAIADYYRSR